MDPRNLTREFELTQEDRTLQYKVDYDITSHSFNITENEKEPYRLVFHMETKTWSIQPEGAGSLPAEELAMHVQKSFGIYV